MKTIVLAVYSEDISWVELLPPAIQIEIVLKRYRSVPPRCHVAGYCRNEGREAHSFTWYVAEYFDQLKGTYYFAQGHPFDHVHNFLKQVTTPEFDDWSFRDFGDYRLQTHPSGAPQHPGLKIHQLHRVFAAESQLREVYKCFSGAIFQAHRLTLQSRPRDLYVRLAEEMKHSDNAWAMERLWRLFFTEDVIWNGRVYPPKPMGG